MRARSISGGWEGRVAALEKGGRRATLEAGGIRVTVPLEDLEPAVGGQGDSGGSEAGGRRGPDPSGTASGSTSRLQLDRARTVATSLDLRGAKVTEALEVLDRYLDDASLAGLDQATVIHGLGTGALRDAVRDYASSHPLVKSWRPGGRGEGGDGATVVAL
jgi:DNA mismatch repair protein MutS2